MAAARAAGCSSSAVFKVLDGGAGGGGAAGDGNAGGGSCTGSSATASRAPSEAPAGGQLCHAVFVAASGGRAAHASRQRQGPGPAWPGYDHPA
eukprot:16430546-Heterocapsa_arctica.AAC.1